MRVLNLESKTQGKGVCKLDGREGEREGVRDREKGEQIPNSEL